MSGPSFAAAVRSSRRGLPVAPLVSLALSPRTFTASRVANVSFVRRSSMPSTCAVSSSSAALPSPLPSLSKLSAVSLTSKLSSSSCLWLRLSRRCRSHSTTSLELTSPSPSCTADTARPQEKDAGHKQCGR